MLERLFVEQAAPTLAGIKPAACFPARQRIFAGASVCRTGTHR